jgi:thiosulfate dehydrogenase (quinone) large subunit
MTAMTTMTTMTATPGSRAMRAESDPRGAAPATMLSGRQGLALLRIGLGLLFLVSAWEKTTKGWLVSGEPLAKSVAGNLPKAEAFYRPFLEGTALPNAGLLAQLVTLGEWVAGLSLTFGILTRLGALSAMWLLLNYMAMKGILTGQYLTSTVNSDRLYFIGALVCCLAAAGLTWGLDGRLRGVLARLPLASWLAGVRAVPQRIASPIRRRISIGRSAVGRRSAAGLAAAL